MLHLLLLTDWPELHTGSPCQKGQPPGQEGADGKCLGSMTLPSTGHTAYPAHLVQRVDPGGPGCSGQQVLTETPNKAGFRALHGAPTCGALELLDPAIT